MTCSTAQSWSVTETDGIQVCDSKFWPWHPWVLYVCLLKDAREERRLASILIKAQTLKRKGRGQVLTGENSSPRLPPTRPRQLKGQGSAAPPKAVHPYGFPSALSGTMRVSSARTSEQEPSCFCCASEDAFCFSLKASGSYKSNRILSRVYFPIWIRESVNFYPGPFGPSPRTSYESLNIFPSLWLLSSKMWIIALKPGSLRPAGDDA